MKWVSSRTLNKEITMMMVMMMMMIIAIKVHTCAGPKGFRKLRLPDIQTIGRWWYVVSPTRRPPLVNIAGTHFCRTASVV